MAKLPSGYTQLQWIGSSGTQYIDTGYIMTSDNVEYGCKYIGRSPSSKSLFGSETYTVNKYSGVPYGVNPYTRVYIGNTYWDSVDQTPTLGENSYTLKYDGVTLTTILNGIIKTVEAEIIIQKELPIYVFANNRSGTTIQQTSIKMRSFYIKDDGELVVNLIPAKRKSDGVLGMYDLISNTFLTNQGTGDFIAGPEYPKCNVYGVSIKGGSFYTRLEYLESTGTQYIDTGVILTSEHKVESKYQQTEAGRFRLFGGRQGSTSKTFSIGAGTNINFLEYGWHNTTTTTDISLDTNEHIVVFDGKGRKITLDGSNDIALSDNTFETPVACAIFAIRGTNQVYLSTPLRVFSFKVWDENNSIIRDLIPAQRNSDGVLGMLDLTSNTFYTNAGTGTFVPGPKI